MDVALPTVGFFGGSMLTHLSGDTRILCRRMFSGDVLVLGDGPFDAEAVFGALSACEVSASTSPGAGAEIVILGHDGWNEDDLETAVRGRAGEDVRVYSHEMFLASLCGGQDVYDGCSLRELDDFGVGHSGLQFLRQALRFAWPSRVVPRSLRRAARFAPEPDSGFSSGSAVKHISAAARGAARTFFGSSAGVMGSGPFEEDPFGRLMSALGTPRMQLADYPDLVVVGHSDWDEQLLNEVIAANAGGSLRI